MGLSVEVCSSCEKWRVIILSKLKIIFNNSVSSPDFIKALSLFVLDSYDYITWLVCFILLQNLFPVVISHSSRQLYAATSTYVCVELHI